MIAIGAQRALKETGLNLPEDMSMIGFGDIAISSHLQPSLTTIQIPTKDMGDEAAIILTHLIDNRNIRCMQVLVDTRLVVKESCVSRK